MEISIEKITPEMARMYLENNCINRRISESRVRCFAKDMQNGKWQINGEAIQFNTQGLLVNGQHRLSAIIKAGIDVDMCVIRGINKNVNIFDRGRVRSSCDSLIIGGMSKELASNKNVATAKLHYYIQCGIATVSDSDVEIFLKLHEDTFAKLSKVANNKSRSDSKGIRVNCTVAPLRLAALYACEVGVPEDTLKRFFNVLSTGLNNGPEEFATTICRNDILSDAIKVKGGSPERKIATYQCEKAICDFANGFPRQKTYANYNKPIYSNNIIFKED